MLTDEELPPLPPQPWLGYDPEQGDLRGYLFGHMREYARAVERAAYERAARECEPHDDDDSIDRQIKRALAERIRALGRK